MKTTKIKTQNLIGALVLLTFISFNSPLATVQAQGTTAFTFQGRLNTASGAAAGSYDMTFAVWNTNVAGTCIAGPITNAAVAVSNGLFIVTLNFGSVFTGTNYWIEMAVGTNGSGSFVTLAPRQSLTPAPYALYAASAAGLAPTASQTLCPPGSVTAFAGASIPAGWLSCNGVAVSRTTYTNLFATIGTSWGTGDGSTTFNLPDMRGVFLLGVDGGRGQDPDANARSTSNTGGNSGNAVGSYQGDMFASHQHGTTAYNGGSFNYGYGGNDPNAATYGGSGNYPTSLTSASGGNETRPRNVYVNYIIKY